MMAVTRETAWNISPYRVKATSRSLSAGLIMSSILLETGARLGKYEVQTHIASGGMGAVYKALDVELGRPVALKVLMSNAAHDDRDFHRFKREADHAAKLSHPHIVAIYDFGHDKARNLHYLALEYVDGIDLLTCLRKRGQLMPEETRRIVIQVAKALNHAFERGIVHRDIKPGNIMLGKQAGKISVKLTDLGLALMDSDSKFQLTTQGTTVGTIDYMSPEQARDSRSADIRSDIYSLGCTAYHMLAGKAPFAEGGLGERLVKHLETPPTDVREHNGLVSAEFWFVLAKMLAKKPEDRYTTPAELLNDLKRIPAEASTEGERTTVLDLPTSPKTESDGSPSAGVPAPKKRRRKRSPTEAPAPLVSAEQARAAAAFHQRAAQVLAEGGGDEYARQLLANCLQLDPGNITYRQTLRDMTKKASTGMLGRWFGSINVLAIKSKLHLARGNSDWRKVLELGEDVLARSPADVDVHISMSEAAEKLNLSDLALWFLEQGRTQLPDSVELMRALAGLHESRRDWKRAIRLWEKVIAKDPSNQEAFRKLNALSVQEHMSSFEIAHGEPSA